MQLVFELIFAKKQVELAKIDKSSFGAAKYQPLFPNPFFKENAMPEPNRPVFINSFPLFVFLMFAGLILGALFGVFADKEVSPLHIAGAAALGAVSGIIIWVALSATFIHRS